MEEAIKLNDKVYTLSPVTSEGFASAVTYYQYLPYHKLVAIKDQFADQDLLRESLRELLKECAKKSVTLDEFKNALDGPDALELCSYLFWVSLHPKHPNLTVQDVHKLLPSGTELMDATTKLSLISGWDAAAVSIDSQKKTRKMKPST